MGLMSALFSASTSPCNSRHACKYRPRGTEVGEVNPYCACLKNTHTRNFPRADLAMGLDGAAHVIHIHSYVIFFTQKSFFGEMMWKRQHSKGFTDGRSAFTNHWCGTKSNPTFPSEKKNMKETDVCKRIRCSWGRSSVRFHFQKRTAVRVMEMKNPSLTKGPRFTGPRWRAEQDAKWHLN